MIGKCVQWQLRERIWDETRRDMRHWGVVGSIVRPSVMFRRYVSLQILVHISVHIKARIRGLV